MNEKKIAERIGTIHTFQGREANEVFIVLGCDKNSSSGSFSFVSSNIVNVAVSRAKKKVCFVGDKQLWTERNSFLRIASEELERYQQLIQSESGRQWPCSIVKQKSFCCFLKSGAFFTFSITVQYANKEAFQIQGRNTLENHSNNGERRGPGIHPTSLSKLMLLEKLTGNYRI